MNKNIKIIEGWVAEDESGLLHLHTNKPILHKFDGSWYEYDYWTSEGNCHQVSPDLFPDITFENSPKKVRITIEEI